jgi:resuscitation-promoting factor RpfA
MGRHSAPSQTKRRLAQIGSAALASATLPLVSTGSAEAASTTQILEAIAHCESGNRNVPNSTGASTASGYLQIVNGTWRAYGGTQYASRALGASRAEQFAVGHKILQGQGLGAWSESRRCWQSKIGKVSAPAPEPAKKTPIKQKTTAPKLLTTQPEPKISTAKRAARSYVIKRGDTLAKIAAKNGTTWRKLADLNRDTVKNPNRIYTGNHLRLR